MASRVRTRHERLTPATSAVLTLRVLTELGVVAAFATWGVHTGGSTAAEVALGIAAPAAGFGFWGAVDFRWAGGLAEPLRLVQELAVSLLAAAAWWAAQQHALGLGLGALTVVYHALVYARGGRLLD